MIVGGLVIGTCLGLADEFVTGGETGVFRSIGKRWIKFATTGSIVLEISRTGVESEIMSVSKVVLESVTVEVSSKGTVEESEKVVSV